MSAYLDASLLASLLVPNSNQAIASRLVAKYDGPLRLNVLHQLQAENLAMRLVRSPEASKQRHGLSALKQWRHYNDEGVFEIVSAPFEEAIRTALHWNATHPGFPPLSLLILHPALALHGGARDFISLNPPSRAIAKRAGLKLVPAL